MTIEYYGLISKLFEYNLWAFEKVWECIEEISDQQFTTELDYSRGSIRNQIIHVISTAERWHNRILGMPVPDYLVNDSFPTKLIARQHWDAHCQETGRLLESLTDRDFDRVIPWALPHRKLEAKSTVIEILFHLLNHATDHRSQILAMLHYEFHTRTVEQDFLFFLAEHQNDRG